MHRRLGSLATGLAVVLLLLCAAGQSAHASTTGKITGTVLDADTGDPLPGVNLIVVGTGRGTTTDEDGSYLILAVEPGTYSLSASMIGYGTEIRQGLKVVAGYTSTVNFKLAEATLEMAEVVVMAERPPVEPDKTTSKHVVTATDIETVPIIRNATELMALQPGMALDGSDRIRGSSGGEGLSSGGVGYYIDGIEVQRGTFNDVNVSAIQEATVLTGGMNAEFGNARAGVVTMVTKEGGGSYGGEVEYKLTPSGKRHWGTNLYDSPAHLDHIRWSDPDWVDETYTDNGHPGPDGVMGTADDDDPVHRRTDYSGHLGHYVEGSLNGPIGESVSFFVSTRYARGVSRLPSPAPTSLFNTRNVATLTVRPTGNIKLKLGGVYERHKSYYVPNADYGGIAKGMGASGRNIFLPEDWSAAGRNIERNQLAYLTMTHTMGVKTFYDLRVYYTGSKVDTADVPAETEPYYTDQSGWFYLPRKIRAFRLMDDQAYGVKLDFTSQVTRAHLFQAGLDLKRHSYYETIFNFGPTPKDRVISYVGRDYEFGKGVRPWSLDVYAQDKLEFHGLIVNAGVRWDYLNFARKARQAPGMELFPMFNTFTRRKYELQYLEDNTLSMSAYSPRVGISHPITDRLAAHYFIGRFHSFPALWNLYALIYESQSPDQDLNGNGRIDPAEEYNALVPQGWTYQISEGMQPETATSVEMGVDWNFYQDYVTSVTTHYRYDEGLYVHGGNWLYDPFLGATHYVSSLRNAVAAKTRGVEVSLRKDFSHHFSFRVAYDMQWVSGTQHYGDRESWRFYPDSSYVASGRYWTSWNVEADGSETPVPLTPQEIEQLGAKANRTLEGWVASTGQPFGTGYYTAPTKVNEAGIWTTTSGYGYGTEPVTYDRRNQLSVQLFYATPLDHGPRWLGIHPAGGLSASCIYRLIDGLPFEYYPPVGAREWRKAPPVMRTDLRVTKDFGTYRGAKASLFVEVQNLFNEKSSTVRYSDFSFVQYGLKEPAPDDTNFLTYGDTRDYSRYAYDPRLIEFGFRLGF